MAYAKGRPLRLGRGRRQPAVSTALYHWLRTHPQAWSGWPTFDALDWIDQQARRRRLVAAGCPEGLLSSLPAVNVAIARIRLQRRATLERQAARGALEGIFLWTGC